MAGIRHGARAAQIYPADRSLRIANEGAYTHRRGTAFKILLCRMQLQLSLCGIKKHRIRACCADSKTGECTKGGELKIEQRRGVGVGRRRRIAAPAFGRIEIKLLIYFVSEPEDARK